MAGGPIVENTIMWPMTSFTWRIDDEPRGPLECLCHTVFTGCARTILIPKLDLVVENPPLKFYDRATKERIYEKEVWPVLAAVYPEDWPGQGGDILRTNWPDMVDFFTTLVWCSKLRVPFVFDVAILRRCVTNARNALLREGHVTKAQRLSGFLAIMELYRCEVTAAHVTPVESGRGTAIELWKELRGLSEYRELSRETHGLGLANRRDLGGRLQRIEKAARAVAENEAVRGVVGIGRSAIALAFGAVGAFVSDVGGEVGKRLLRKPYAPPIYLLPDIERSFDEVYYPNRPKGSPWA